MRHTFNVAVDLDGVLADWEKRVGQLMHISKNQVKHILDEIESDYPVEAPPHDKKAMWKVIHRYDERIPFYYTLEKMPDADILWDFLLEYVDHDSLFILSAGGYTPKDVKEQKRRWVRRYLGDYRTEIVDKSPDKAQFATPNTILIDDREKSLEPWRAAGGIAVLHTSAEDTIRQLRELLGV